MVERVEVVVDALDLGPLGDREAEADEDVLDLAPGLRSAGAGRPTGGAGAPGRVTSTRSAASRASSSAALELGAARLDQRLQRLARHVRRLADAPRCSGGSCATPRSRFGSSALRPRNRTRACSSASRRGGGGDRRLRLGRSSCDPLDHAGHPMLGGDGAARHLVERDGRGHRGVQRLAVRSGSWRRGRTRRRCSGGSPPARRRRRASVGRRPPRALGERLALARARPSADRASPGQLARRRRRRPARAAPRTPRPSTPAPPSARTGPRSRGRARRSRRRTRAPSAAPCRRCRGREPVQRDAQRTDAALGPALLVHRQRPRPGAKLRDVRQQLRLDLDAVQPAARRAVALQRRPAGRVGGRKQVLALGDEAARLLTRAPPRELADLLEAVVVRGADGQAWSLNEKGRRS